MRLSLLLASISAPLIGLAAPVAHDDEAQLLAKRENLCSLPSPPELCQPDPSVGVEETAQRAYDFYRSFVVDGDPRTMFSLIDSSYIVSWHSFFLFSSFLFLLLSSTWADAKHGNATAATPPGVRVRASEHLAPFLQREQDRKRGQHRLVLRRRHEHVLRAILHHGQVALGRWLRPRTRTCLPASSCINQKSRKPRLVELNPF